VAGTSTTDGAERVVTRTDIINRVAWHIVANRYLEIGVASGVNFSKVDVPIKVGVDPVWRTDLCTHEMTSDEFFDSHMVPFDIVFIDGLHEDGQVRRDINNALACGPNVFVVCHDMNPEVETYQKGWDQLSETERFGPWTGDCWKAWAHLRVTRPDLSMFVVDTDYGCGVITAGSQEPLGYYEPTWRYFDEHRAEILNLISVDQFDEMFPVALS